MYNWSSAGPFNLLDNRTRTKWPTYVEISEVLALVLLNLGAREPEPFFESLFEFFSRLSTCCQSSSTWRRTQKWTTTPPTMTSSRSRRWRHRPTSIRASKCRTVSGGSWFVSTTDRRRQMTCRSRLEVVTRASRTVVARLSWFQIFTGPLPMTNRDRGNGVTLAIPVATLNDQADSIVKLKTAKDLSTLSSKSWQPQCTIMCSFQFVPLFYYINQLI